MLFAPSLSDEEASNAHGMPTEHSLTAGSNVAIVRRVECDPSYLFGIVDCPFPVQATVKIVAVGVDGRL
jgi:hypothetical protein